jgi:hypothetical protein
MISTNHIRLTHRVYTYLVLTDAKRKRTQLVPKNVRLLHVYPKQAQVRRQA